MTRDQAEELVSDLIQAYWDYEQNTGRKSYREDFYDIRERVVSALAQQGKTP